MNKSQKLFVIAGLIVTAQVYAEDQVVKPAPEPLVRAEQPAPSSSFKTVDVAALDATMTPEDLKLCNALQLLGTKAENELSDLHKNYEQQAILLDVQQMITDVNNAIKMIQLYDKGTQKEKNAKIDKLKVQKSRLTAQLKAYEKLFGTLDTLLKEQYRLQKQLNNALKTDEERDAAEYILDQLYWAERKARKDMDKNVPGLILWLTRLFGPASSQKNAWDAACCQ